MLWALGMSCAFRSFNSMLSAKFPACHGALDKQHAALGHRKSFVVIPKPSEVAYMVYLEGVSKLAEWNNKF